jgi:hypothetical protein
VIKLHHKAQEQYDDETDYSRNFKEQEEWQNRIAAELKSLESFAKYRR